jgi:hypothetical protein
VKGDRGSEVEWLIEFIAFYCKSSIKERKTNNISQTEVKSVLEVKLSPRELEALSRSASLNC